MAYSPLEFVRALKAAADPPQPDGPTKLQIAHQTWHDGSVYIPDKDETIVDWLLTRLLKEKDTLTLLDVQIWTLLDDILHAAAKSAKAARPLRTWLLPLLNRVPSAPILIAFLSSVDASTPDLLCVGSRALALIWPLAVPRISVDALLDCYGAVVKLYTHRFWISCDDITRETSLHLLNLVVSSYRSSLANSGTKKKLYPHFTQNLFESWLQASALDDEDLNLATTRENIFQAGIETLFSVDLLRSAQEHPFVDVLRSAVDLCPGAVPSCLPRIFQSYLEVTNKHRSTLYSQGPSRGAGASIDQARIAGLKFFTSCSSALDNMQDAGGAWRTRSTLLGVIEERQLLGSNDDAGTLSLTTIAEQACELLLSPKTDTQGAVADAALSAFVAIIHIDYELVTAVLPRVLQLMVTRPLSLELSCALLDHVIEYSTKLRSADTLVDLLLSACSPQTFDRSSPSLHTTAVSSALLHHVFLEKLSKFVHVFTTPGQISKLVECALRYLREASQPLEGRDGSLKGPDDTPGPRKKRKTEKPYLPVSSALERSAISLALTASLSSVVLTSLPLHVLQDNAREEVVQAIQVYYNDTQPIIKDAMKHIRIVGCAETWSHQTLVASMLGLRHALSSDRRLQLATDIDTKLVRKLTSLLEIEGLLPHLRIEILRAWLLDVEKGRSEPELALEEVLLCVERLVPQCDRSWAGDLRGLYSPDHQNVSLAVAVLHILLDRWLPLFDTFASAEQCRRLVNVISQAQEGEVLAATDGISVQHVLHRVLRNAAFWEMHNIRAALLAHLSDQTEAIDQLDVDQVLSASRQQPSFNIPHYLQSSVGGPFGLLASTPVEYLSRKSRADLLRRAHAADIAFSVGATGPGNASRVTLLRDFLRRVYTFLGSIDRVSSSDYLNILMDSFSGGDSQPRSFTWPSLELIKMHLSSVVKTAAKGEDAVLLQLTTSFIRSPALNAPFGQGYSGPLRVQALVYLIDVLNAEYKATEFTEGVLERLGALREQLAGWLLPHMTMLTSPEHDVDTSHHLPALQTWHRLLLLSTWLSSGVDYPLFGRLLTSRQLFLARHRNTHSVETVVTILSIVQAEFTTRRSSTTDADPSSILATYLAFSDLFRESGLDELDDCLAKLCKSLTLADFSGMLDLAYEAMESHEFSDSRNGDLIHASDVLMRNAPEGSLKALQTHISRCLDLCSDRIALGKGDALRDKILRFMSCQFNDRPAMIRQQDLSSVWSILGACLAGSTQHLSTTAKSTFSDTVSVINALIRLRRDLISTTLPHLGFVLRRLFSALRRLRPHLGGKQSRMVADTLPTWISPEEPARIEDSRALARLLTTLTTKTVVRTYGSSTEGQKAESMARPFSKHAASVLCAYIEALNDPLCVLPAPLRRELDPALFALCDMMGERNRDAMMVSSLDNGGRAIMKGIWREYEKQKYVGKG